MSNENMHMPNAIRFDQKSNFEIGFQKAVSFVGVKKLTVITHGAKNSKQDIRPFTNNHKKI